MKQRLYFFVLLVCEGLVALARLEKNEQLRVGIDPISGTKVDKATAIIAADAYNRVYYFESKENLAKANAKLQEK